MNTTNANQIFGFDKFSESNYNLHWSFSNFNRMLMVAGQIAQLPSNSKVLELGAGTSDLENLVKKNFQRDDITFFKVDGDEQYESCEEITVLDITKQSCRDYMHENGPFNAVVFMEVIEHLELDDMKGVLMKIADNIVSEGLLFVTTPTPPFEALYETEVWPTDHEMELTHDELYGLLNIDFKITKEIGWSLEEREYNKLLECDETIMKIYGKLRCAYPESYIRALIANIAPIQANRQVLLVCKKRRIANGRLAQTR